MSNATCHFCGTPEPLDEHHIVPRRFGGSDDRENIVTVCPTCHRKLERLYDRRFYTELGVTSEDSDGEHICASTDCTSLDTRKLGGYTEIWCCDDHAICRAARINEYRHAVECRDDASAVLSVPDGGLSTVCDDHAVCNHDGCQNRDVRYGVPHTFGMNVYCEFHRPDEFDTEQPESTGGVDA